MTPECVSTILQAWMNHRRPRRTHGAKVMDALAHCRQSALKKNAAIEAARINVDENPTPPQRNPHL